MSQSHQKQPNRLLGFIIALQVLMLLSQWRLSDLPQARAQVPDSGAQRLEIIDQLKATNAKLDQMIGILQSGKLQVVPAKPDETDKK